MERHRKRDEKDSLVSENVSVEEIEAALTEALKSS